MQVRILSVYMRQILFFLSPFLYFIFGSLFFSFHFIRLFVIFSCVCLQAMPFAGNGSVFKRIKQKKKMQPTISLSHSYYLLTRSTKSTHSNLFVGSWDLTANTFSTHIGCRNRRMKEFYAFFCQTQLKCKLIFLR